MPRLSLYKPEKGKDYTFLDRQISEMFTVGGTDIHLHKYLGPANPDEADATADKPRYDAVKETNIQDLLFLENRDRKYDPDVYTLRGIYSIQDIDFNMTQFGFMLDNDTLMLTVHINNTVKTVGRKIIAGDVLELPHLKDEYALNDYSVALKRFYVVEDVTRPSEGFSPTWYPHLYRLKLKQIVDSQEFKEILDLPAEEGSSDTLRDLLSTYEKEMQINDAVVAQAEADAPKSGYDISHYYTLETDGDGNVEVTQVAGQTVTDHPAKPGYQGYLIGDELTPNGESFGHGIQFPTSASAGDYFLRTDFLPKRMFRYDGSRWIKVQDVVRMTMTNTSERYTQKGTFINNTDWTYNERVVSDFLTLEEGATEFVTQLDYPINGLYIAFKYKIIEDAYVIADWPTLVTDDGNGKVKITLPVRDNVQQAIPYPGQWEIIVFNNREAERQALSKALRPKADY